MAFTKLWRRKETTESTSDRTIAFERFDGTSLQFEGELKMESCGDQRADYLLGEAFHRIFVYTVDRGGFAAIIEFHRPDTAPIIDGEVVESISELDDLFCLHAADQFPELSIEQRHGSVDGDRLVLARYDRQMMEILNSLKAEPQQAVASETSEADPQAV